MKNSLRKIAVTCLGAIGLRGICFKIADQTRITYFTTKFHVLTARFRPDERLIYKSTPQTDLMLHIFRSKTRPPEKGFPAIVFFHGGGWENGIAKQFYPQCHYFASRGMLAISVDYRTLNHDGASPWDATADAISAVRWVRRNAAKLAIDPDQIVVGGASVGGHMTAAVTFLQELADPDEDDSIDPAANAMILFNGVLDTTERGWGSWKLGDDMIPFSPLHNIKKGLPPSIVLHGTADDVTPYHSAVEFTAEMKKQGNDCNLFTYPGGKHGFFRYWINRRRYHDTLEKCDEFLVSHGFLKPVAGRQALESTTSCAASPE